MKTETKKIELNLEDLRVESFEALPELSEEEMSVVVGGSSCCSSCTCNSGDTVVCVDPSGTGAIL